MKKARWVLLAVTLGLATMSAYADDDHQGQDNDDHNKTGHSSSDATEMSLLGLGAASLAGAGAYFAYRRRGKTRG